MICNTWGRFSVFTYPHDTKADSCDPAGWPNGCAIFHAHVNTENRPRVFLIESFCNDVPGDDSEHVIRFIDHLWYTAPLIRLSENQAKAGGKSYTWLFAVESTVPFMKCAHSIELATLLNHPEITEFTGRQFDETFSRTMRRMWVQFAKTGNPSLTADISPDGRDHEWPLYDTENKRLMVFEEFNIHPEKESDRKLVDWDRTYFLTKYYC